MPAECTCVVGCSTSSGSQCEQQQVNHQRLSWHAEVLPVLAELSELNSTSSHCTLAPAWLASGSTGSTPHHLSSSTAHEASSNMNGTLPVDAQTWAQLEQSVLQAAAAAHELGHPMASDDIIAAVSALTWLGVCPGPHCLSCSLKPLVQIPLGLTAEGLCSLLWILSAEVTQQQSAQAPIVSSASSQADRSYTNGSSSSNGSGMSSGGGGGWRLTVPQLLQLASRACSSLAVRPAGRLSVRQLARTTWAVAALAKSQPHSMQGAAAAAAAGSVWLPPEPCVRWLDWGWEAGLSRETRVDPGALAAQPQLQRLGSERAPQRQ